VEGILALLIDSMTGGSPLRITIRVALRKPLPEPSPAYGSRFKNDDRQEGAKIKTWKPAGSLSPAPAFVRFWTTAEIVEFFWPGTVCPLMIQADIGPDQNLKPVVGSLILLLVILEAATGREGEEIEISAEWTRTRKP
jgi:hypothetical protein